MSGAMRSQSRSLPASRKSSVVAFDVPYDLLPVSVHDAVQNNITAVNDYRVLQPVLVTDPNGNRSTVAFDALGLVAGTAVTDEIADRQRRPADRPNPGPQK